MIDPRYTDLIVELGEYVNRKIDREWKDSFGSMVLITTPRDLSVHRGDVTGWAAPEVRAAASREDVLLHSFFTLALTLVGHVGVSPEALHQLVMDAAVTTGAAQVIIVGPDDKDLPQA